MDVDQLVEVLGGLLFEAEDEFAFAVLDGASAPGLLRSLAEHEPEYVCLYRGELAPDVAEVAPYLVRLEPETEFTWWLISEGWGKHWGIFVSSPADLRTLRHHFRTFLTVYDSDGKPMLFRYYDPRVLRTYLPTCNGGELATLFGPIQKYLVESEDAKAIIRFQVIDGQLTDKRLPVEPIEGGD
jgi:Domain of unknown function (DUF4123)